MQQMIQEFISSFKPREQKPRQADNMSEYRFGLETVGSSIKPLDP